MPCQEKQCRGEMRNGCYHQTPLSEIHDLHLKETKSKYPYQTWWEQADLTKQAYINIHI